MSHTQMKVYCITEELLHRIYPRLAKFPHAEKYALSQSIKNNFFDLLKLIALGESVKSKRKTYLQEADGHLQTLKVLFRLANRRKYISVAFYRSVDLELTEINKLLAGFIRSASK